MKTKLFTKNPYLAMLMALVLVLGVQGIADALSFQTRTSGDLVTVSRNQEFTITFYPQPKSRVAEFSGTTRGSRAAFEKADVTATDTVSGFVNSNTVTDLTAETAGNYYYYDRVTTPAVSGGTRATTTRTWLSESAAYYYNDEAVTISSDITLTRNGMTIPVDGSTDALLDRHADSHRRLGSSITLKGSHPTPGAHNITITDSTPAADFPSDAQPTTPRNTVTFTIYVVLDRAGTPATPTLEVATGTNYATDGNDFTDQIIDPADTSATTDYRIKYEVVEGPGRLYVQIDGPPIRKTSALRTLLTSNAAAVRLDMNGGTNKVKASAAGAPSTTGIFIFGYPTVAITGGNNQEGVFGGRLEDSLVVKVTDGKGRAISGLAATFEKATTPATGTTAKFIPFSGTAVYITDAGALAATFAAATGGTRTATPTRPMPADTILVQTDSRGEAKTYFQLSNTTTETSQGVTVIAGGVSPISPASFRFTAGSGTRRPTLSILSGNNQRTDSEGDIEDPLVVVVRRDGNLKPNEKVTFRTIKGTIVGGYTKTTFDAFTGDRTALVASTSGSKRAYDITDGTGRAQVTYFQDPGEGSDTVTATISGDDYEKTVTFNINGSARTREPTPPSTATNTITISLSSSTGEPGDEIDITVTSDPSGRSVTIDSGDLDDDDFSRLSGVTTFRSTIVLPDEEGEYDFSASSAGLASDSATVTVETGILGRISITSLGAPSNGTQLFTITVQDTDGDRISGALTVTVSGSGFTTTRVDTRNGIGDVRLTLPTTARLYTLTVSAENYTSGTTQVRIAASGQQQDTEEEEEEEEQEEETPTVSEPDSIRIIGPSQRSGPANSELDAALIVQVVDVDGDAVEDARVIFRVRTGQGRLSQRGNGRAIAVQTDADGYARAAFTPTSAGPITVEAEVRGVSQKVTFTITATGSSPDTTTPGAGVILSTGGTPSTTVSPVLNAAVDAASRPPMLWVSGGQIYALVGSEVKVFIAGVENVMNIAVGAGKVYWTAKTSETHGTLNSANLDGTGAKELRSLWGVPRGIAVDTAGSKLYWVDAANRLQRADLDGSDIENVLRNLSDPQDVVLAGGNVYWIGNGSGTDTLSFINLSDPKKEIHPIVATSGTYGGLAIAGSKVYWTEKTSDTHGTLHSANLDGTGVAELRDDPIWGAPVGIAIDTARSRLYWTDAVGRLQRANLDGSGIHNVVKGLGRPRNLVLSNSITEPAETPSTTTSKTSTTGSNKYDINADGTVDSKDSDMLIVAVAARITDAKYDVNGDGKVDINDVVTVTANRDKGAASAPALLGTKFTAVERDRLQEQIDLLIATGDRSPAALKTLVYLQQLLVMARPEKTQLLANYPNPFNPETWIPYELATDTDVRITIYNAQGIVIRTLQLGQQAAGYYTDRERAAYWDGRNALGEQVASGVYFYQLETDEMSSLRKMVILK